MEGPKDLFRLQNTEQFKPGDAEAIQKQLKLDKGAAQLRAGQSK